MAKKYYWLKLKEDFFRQKEIKKLRRIAGGDTYVIIYLKLQLLSIKNEGKLFFEEIEDDFAEELALDLDEDVENVRVTLLYLEKHHLIEFTQIENEYLLPEVLACIGKESESAERVRRHRLRKKQKQKEQLKALHCNALVTKCNTEIEIEKETEQQQEIEQKIEQQQELENTNVVVEIFNQFDIDILPVIKKYPAIKILNEEELCKVAKTLSDKKAEGKIINPVGILLSNPQKTLSSILKGNFYPSVKKENRSRSASYATEYEIYVPPEM